jgi:small subunit ribosomal protein S9
MTDRSAKDFFTGVGRRKSAVAQTRIQTGRGNLNVNKESRDVYASLKALFELIGKDQQLDVDVIVRGGGIRSQLDAINLGVARALVKLNPDLRSSLRKAGLLTRDARVKERKKPGLKRARRAPQWAKR